MQDGYPGPAAVGGRFTRVGGGEAKARELRDQGLSVDEITKRLLGREGFLAGFSFGDFSHRNLVQGLLADPA